MLEQSLMALNLSRHHRPDHCPQCETHRPLRAHGFYTRTLVDVAFDGTIRVRRYLCCCCKRTLSLLPEFALPVWSKNSIGNQAINSKPLISLCDDVLSTHSSLQHPLTPLRSKYSNVLKPWVIS